jgi:predicted nucleotidyltransferase
MTAGASFSDIERVLDGLVTSLREVGRANVLGVALYGGVAKGRYTEGISDINVLVLLEDASFAALERLAPILTAARRAHRVAAFVLARDELATVARLFPVKMIDIKSAHRVLHGDLALGAVTVDPSAARLRALQELANTELRLRQRLLDRGGEPEVLWAGLVQALPKLAVTLETLLRLGGGTVPGARPEVLRSAGRVLGARPELIERFASIRRQDARPADDSVRAAFADFLVLLRELRERTEVEAEGRARTP